jgi:uncharacterized protein UPF0261
MAKKTIVLLGCFDTKGEPCSRRRDRIASRGLGTLLVDISFAAEPTIEPDISASEIARAAGDDPERLRAAGDRGNAIAAMGCGGRAGDTGLAAEFILRNFKPIEPLAIAKVEQTPSKHRRTPETSQGANVERIEVGSRRARPDRKKNLISG